MTNQGTATVSTAFNVAIYASHGVTIGPYSILLGEVTIPAGLGGRAVVVVHHDAEAPFLALARDEL